MINIGEYSTLEVNRSVEFGFYLDGGPLGEILLPGRYAPEDLKPGAEIKVFVYCDSEDRVIATTEVPKAVVGELALLEVKDTGNYGAFVDWGLTKDLLVPYREQAKPMEKGLAYLVMVCLDDKTERLIGSTRLNRFFNETSKAYKAGDEVDITIAIKTTLGWKVVVDRQYWGMIYHSEIFQDINIGDQLKAFVKQVRSDHKLDISLRRQGFLQIQNEVERVKAALKESNGFLPITDKSSPEMIYKALQLSKKAFKRAVGSLYKQRLIVLEEEGIREVE